MKIGYARVSTDEQHLDLQLHALKKSGCEVIFSDRGISGAKFERPGLQGALDALAPGDTLTVWKLDRLGRSLGHLVRVMGELDRDGVRVVSLTEAIDTRSPAGRFSFHMIAALAEFERSLISERTRAGIDAARKRGRRHGRPEALDAQKLQQARALLKSQSERSVAQTLNVHYRTLRRKLKEDSGACCSSSDEQENSGFTGADGTSGRFTPAQEKIPVFACASCVRHANLMENAPSRNLAKLRRTEDAWISGGKKPLTKVTSRLSSNCTGAGECPWRGIVPRSLSCPACQPGAMRTIETPGVTARPTS